LQGVLLLNFNDIDFKGGKACILEKLGEDMLEVHYENGYAIDVGFIENLDSFFVTITKDNDWVNIEKELEAKTADDLKLQLKCAIDYVLSK